MKQGTLIVRIIIIVFFVGVLAYFGVYIWDSLTDNTATATLYTHTAESRLEGTGWFFRDEALLDSAAGQTEVLCAEGERVGKGDAVARIYANSEGYELQQELDEAKNTLASLQYILSRTGESADTMALDADIVDTFTDLRAAVTEGDLSDLGSVADELRSLIFRRDYTYNGNDALTRQIDETEALIEVLTAQTSSAYESVRAPAAGLYSSEVDGYEDVLTVAALEGLSPSTLNDLTGRQQSVQEASVGKVITNSGWYFACTLTAAQAKQVYKDLVVTLRFSDSNRDFTAKVIAVSDEENGLVAVTFFSDQFAPQLTALRKQNVDIIVGQATGFRVPKRAVRVAEDGTLGVYRISGAQANWVKIEILWEEADYYLIRQAVERDEDGNVVEQTAFEKAARLRDGDSIIVKGEDLYDGKVVAG